MAFFFFAKGVLDKKNINCYYFAQLFTILFTALFFHLCLCPDHCSFVPKNTCIQQESQVQCSNLNPDQESQSRFTPLPISIADVLQSVSVLKCDTKLINEVQRGKQLFFLSNHYE